MVQQFGGPPAADDGGRAAALPHVAAPAEPPSPPAEPLGKPCRCGHGKLAHEHYRRGTDCALCSCPRYRRTSRLAQLMGRR